MFKGFPLLYTTNSRLLSLTFKDCPVFGILDWKYLPLRILQTLLHWLLFLNISIIEMQYSTPSSYVIYFFFLEAFKIYFLSLNVLTVHDDVKWCVCVSVRICVGRGDMSFVIFSFTVLGIWWYFQCGLLCFLVLGNFLVLFL